MDSCQLLKNLSKLSLAILPFYYSSPQATKDMTFLQGVIPPSLPPHNMHQVIGIIES